MRNVHRLAAMKFRTMGSCHFDCNEACNRILLPRESWHQISITIFGAQWHPIAMRISPFLLSLPINFMPIGRTHDFRHARVNPNRGLNTPIARGLPYVYMGRCSHFHEICQNLAIIQWQHLLGTGCIPSIYIWMSKRFRSSDQCIKPLFPTLTTIGCCAMCVPGRK